MWDKKEFQTVTLPLLLLQLLAQGDKAGLQLVEEIKDNTGGSYYTGLGSLFAILHPLERENYITSYKVEQPGQHMRLYHLEKSGKAYLQKSLTEYQTMHQGMELFIKQLSVHGT